MPSKYIAHPREPRDPIFVIGPSIAYISLTKGTFACVDIEDVPVLQTRSWCALMASRGEHLTWYARRTDYRSNGTKTTLMHKFLCPSFAEVDHRNGNGLDNRRANMRDATREQNMYNTRMSTANQSGYKGVSWSRAGKAWVAQITHDRKVRYLGLHPTPQLAHQAYETEARRLRGEFARA